MIRDGRWRGRMPFRQNREIWTEPLIHQGRTGEPSPALFAKNFRTFWNFCDAGSGKARGSFTEGLRGALAAWMQINIGNTRGPVTFRYRLFRHKIITVTLAHPTIFHRKQYGRGSKGFVLAGEVMSIEGVVPDRWTRRISAFALSRIIGQHPIKVLALPSPQE